MSYSLPQLVLFSFSFLLSGSTSSLLVAVEVVSVVEVGGVIEIVGAVGVAGVVEIVGVDAP